MLPLTLALAVALPISSMVHFWPVTAWMTSGPQMNMLAAFDHDDEIRQRGRISRAAGARAGDDGDLRHDAREQDVAEKHLAVAGERIDRLPGCARRRNR